MQTSFQTESNKLTNQIEPNTFTTTTDRMEKLKNGSGSKQHQTKKVDGSMSVGGGYDGICFGGGGQ